MNLSAKNFQLNATYHLAGFDTVWFDGLFASVWSGRDTDKLCLLASFSSSSPSLVLSVVPEYGRGLESKESGIWSVPGRSEGGWSGKKQSTLLYNTCNQPQSNPEPQGVTQLLYMGEISDIYN